MARSYTKTEIISAAVAVVTLLGGVTELIDKRNEVATLRAEVSSLKLSQETMRTQNERLFQLAVGVVKDGQIPLKALQPFLLPAELKEVSEQASASRRETLPIDIDAAYFPSGSMGDGKSGETFVKIRRKQIEGAGSSKPAVEITFHKGPMGWAGIYWQFPDSNWGDQLGRNLTGAQTLKFLAKGKTGGEIVEFKSGGIQGKKYSDSFDVSLGKIVLKSNWVEYSIDLSHQNLSNVIGAFASIAAATDNPAGVTTFYIANLRFE